jgi:4-amino-4-deoxy-L-arabinose transferase-like glycosyltransferase
MKSRNLIGIVVLLIPLAFMVAWHLGNHALPADDAANHAEVALRISREFRQGMLHGVAAILDVRGWRPIAFAPLSVPFLLLTDGNVVAASAATLGCLLVAVTFYLYRLVRLFSDDSLVSSVTTATVVSMPVVFAYSLVFFSELAWILFSVAFVYHLLRSGPFQFWRHALAAGLYAGLMMAVRPAESVVILFVLLPFLIIPEISSGKLKLVQFLRAAVIFSGPALFLVLSGWIKELDRSVIYVAAIAAAAVGVWLRRYCSESIVAFCSGLYIGCLPLVGGIYACADDLGS